MSFLDDIGITKEELTEGEASTIVKPFEPLKSGVYTATVKDAYTFKNQWDGTELRFTVEVKTEDGEERIISFRRNIGQKLKDGSPNKGFTGRLKQFAHACNVNIDDLSVGSTVKQKNFGTDVDATPIVGLNGKTVKALVRLTNDVNKEEGVKYKYTNDLQGVVAPDGTELGGENGAEKFVETVAKTPIFTIEGKQKAGKTASAATTTASGGSINDML
jgi:hypothetical protein